MSFPLHFHYPGAPDLAWPVSCSNDQLRHMLLVDAVSLALTGNGVVLLDTAGLVLDVNPAAEAMVGWEADQLRGQHCELFVWNIDGTSLLPDLLPHLHDEGRWSGEAYVRHHHGHTLPVRLHLQLIAPGYGHDGCCVAVFCDLSRSRMDQSLITQLTRFDTLTGLPNWEAVQERLQQLLTTTPVPSAVAVLLLDLDRFKAINDAMGQVVGDCIIESLASRLVWCAGSEAMVARRSGDEFCLVLPSADAEAAGQLAERVLALVAQPMELAHQQYILSACIGISLYPEHGESAAQLLSNAGSALHLAKQAGQGNIRFFSHDLTEQARRRRTLEEGLHRALEREEFFLCYQPQLDLHGGATVGMEALIRWRGPDGQLVAPMEFIPLAEQTGQILAIGQWVLRQACRQGRAWHDAGFSTLQMAVNLSPCQFLQDNLPQLLDQVLLETGFPAHCLELEITEGVLMHDPVRAARMLAVLREMGVGFSVDDFGTGYSSLAYLKRFQLDRLKIDRSFVRDCCHDRQDGAIVDAIISLARNLGLDVIAEGVETASQLDFLRAQGCGLVQGYLFSPPLPASEVTGWLTSSIAARGPV
ncbi:putative bifunctional diguanylate cyclase/phosphodiesterase [Chitinimonas lacunae]|uniref:Bifunctional diguanylate cyclase/phosphodiesterase n=1 Tax=Chitinimonas lacunae TaxID=1963018 RepID=A0ABV8MKP5_9NEIS